MSSVFNPELYSMLRSKFGEVKISNQSVPMQFKVEDDPSNPRYYNIKATVFGESYRVCCPVCGDQKFRLWVSYRWNTIDKGNTYKGKPLRFNKYFVRCFRRGCHPREINDMIDSKGDFLRSNVSSTPVEVHTPATINAKNIFKPIEVPGTLVPLHKLDADHKAIAYLLNRGYDIKELEDMWGASYCYDAKHPFVRKRIIFPIMWRGKMVGYQARRTYDIPKEEDDGDDPKYYTSPGLKKSFMLYNLDSAKKYHHCVIVEGVMDAIKVGPRAVALLGKDMSEIQSKLIRTVFKYGSVVVMLDGEAIEDMHSMYSRLDPEMFKGGILEIVVRQGCDPGDLTRDEIEDLIAIEASRKGVSLVI